MKQDLLEEVCVYLLKKSFTVKSLTRSCFDILARRESHILLLKVLQDANSISEEAANEMKRISSYLGAAPIIIAEGAGNKLTNNVVYSRFGVHTLNFNTFSNCIENKFPIAKSTQAGITASIAGDRLREKMEELGYSLNDMSRKLGVSRRMILKYESGSEVSLSKAEKMYTVFGGGIFNRINVFKEKMFTDKSPTSEITRKYDQLGFDAVKTKRAPFDVIAKRKREVILTEVGDKSNPNLTPVKRLLDADSLVIFRKKKPRNIPALTKKEFLEFQKSDQLIKFLKEFE
ncbi:MAG: helix-turn-helix domain-containing protein [bacterium]|nr:helix-turn-helix domain-containing protein [bacterium]